VKGEGADVLLFGEGEAWSPLQLAVPMPYLAIVPAVGLSFWGRKFTGDLAGD